MAARRPGRPLAIAAAVAVVGVEVAVLATRPTSRPRSEVAVGEAPGASVPVTPAQPVAASPTPPADTLPAGATTTLPPAPPTTTVTDQPGAVTYTVPAPVTVTVAAAGACFVEVRASRRAPVISIGILARGDTRSYPAPVWIRLGAPTEVTVTAGGLPLAVPTDEGPVDVVVVPTAAS